MLKEFYHKIFHMNLILSVQRFFMHQLRCNELWTQEENRLSYMHMNKNPRITFVLNCKSKTHILHMTSNESY